MGLPIKIFDPFNAITPSDEIAAYEALWAETNATVKTISEKFDFKETVLPSQLLNPEIIARYLKNIKEIYSFLDFDVCIYGEADYPQKLLDATYPMPLFYYQGALDLVASPSISVVGTRTPSPEGIKRAEKITRLLIDDGFTIISDLAKGIDTAAHTTAINNGGKTIAVIGTPINVYYPIENKKLQNIIAKEHLLISQVPFLRYASQDYRLNRFFFPERNKIMSALSLATVIIEAGESSGTLMKAKEALKQGRKVFILESCFENYLTWPDKLESQGAIRLKDYEQLHNILLKHQK